MGTATKSRSGVAPWKKLLTEAESLRGQSGSNAHRRATILVKLFDDLDFRAERGLADDDAAELVMNELVEDLCLTFYELRAMLTEFPGVSDWSDGRLSSLYDAAAERIQARRPAREPRTHQRQRVTSAEYQRLAGEKQELESRLKYDQTIAGELKAENAELRQQIAKLQIENAELRGRLKQLEAKQ